MSVNGLGTGSPYTGYDFETTGVNGANTAVAEEEVTTTQSTQPQGDTYESGTGAVDAGTYSAPMSLGITTLGAGISTLSGGVSSGGGTPSVGKDVVYSGDTKLLKGDYVKGSDGTFRETVTTPAETGEYAEYVDTAGTLGGSAGDKYYVKAGTGGTGTLFKADGSDIGTGTALNASEMTALGSLTYNKVYDANDTDKFRNAKPESTETATHSKFVDTKGIYGDKNKEYYVDNTSKEVFLANGDQLKEPALEIGTPDATKKVEVKDGDFTSTSVKATLGSSEVSFNNSTGAITWDGKTLDLKSLGLNSKTTAQLMIQSTDEGFTVSDGEKTYQLDKNGNAVTNLDGKTPLEVTGNQINKDAGSVLYINNSGTGALQTGNADNLIINRQENAKITGGSGNDVIVNYATQIDTLSGGSGGNDSLFTKSVVGTGGTGNITLNGNASITTTGNMKDIEVSFTGSGTNTVNAAGYTLTNVDITGSDGAATINAKNVVGGTWNLEGNSSTKMTITGNVSGGTDITGSKIGKDEIEIRGSVTDAKLKLGDGDNSVTVAKAIKGLEYTGGKNEDKLTISGAVSNSTFALGEGVNEFIAQNSKGKGMTLTNVSISAKPMGTGSGGTVSGAIATVSGSTVSGSTTIKAGAYNVTTGKHSIDLGDNANTVTLGSITAKAGTEAAVNMGSAASSNTHTLTVTSNVTGKASNVTISAAGTGANNITIDGKASQAKINLGDGTNTTTIGKAASYVDYTGGSGADKVTLKGGASYSSFDLGAGANELDARKANKKGDLVGQKLTNVSIMSSGSTATDFTKLYAGTIATKVSANDANKVSASQILLKGAGLNEVNATSIAANKNAKLLMELGASGSTAKQSITVEKAVSNATFTAMGSGAEVSTGKATDVTFNLSNGNNTLTVNGAAKNVSYTGGAGSDTMTVRGAITNSELDFGAGAASLTALTTKNDTIKRQTLTDVSIKSDGDLAVEAGQFKSTTKANTVTAGINVAAGGKMDINMDGMRISNVPSKVESGGSAG